MDFGGEENSVTSLRVLILPTFLQSEQFTKLAAAGQNDTGEKMLAELNGVDRVQHPLLPLLRPDEDVND